MKTDWFDFWADIVPSKTAIITDNGTSYDFQHINGIGEKIATHLQSKSILKGDRVAILAQFSIELIYLFSAALKSGIILVPLNYRLTPAEINRLIDDIKPSLLLVEDIFSEKVSNQTEKEELKNFISEAKTIQKIDLPSVNLNREDPVFILYTSGSSGLPKGVLYTYKMLFWNSINTQISLNLDSNTKTIICLPPFHTGGWNVLLTPLIHTGGCSVLLKKFDAEEVLKSISKYKCQIFMGVPTMLKMMADLPIFKDIDLSHLDYIIVGGEAMSLQLIETYHNKGVAIRQGYGMTEVGPNLTSLHEDDAIRKIGSIGKPNMYVETMVVNKDGKQVEPNERGELVLAGPNVTPGYYNNPEESKKQMSDKWFHTGDIVIQDEEGFLYVVDRIKNMYISGAENVYPAEVESVIILHPSVKEVVVVGVPDEQWGESGKAFVVLEEQKKLDIKELQNFCLERLSKYKIPKFLEILDVMPKNDTGKIDRKVLQKK